MTLDQALSIDEIVTRFKRLLGVETLKVATGTGVSTSHGRIGLCVGAGGSFVSTAIDQGATLFLTGEMRHHEALDAVARGCTIILAGHTNTERGYLEILRQRLEESLESAECHISKMDKAPFDVC